MLTASHLSSVDAQAAAAQEQAESEESEADEWDAVDVDNLKIPVAQNFEDELQREEAVGSLCREQSVERL
jgi:hypothetical protein